MATYIGEAASRSGLGVDTIRYYDTLGLLFFGERDRAGRRVFTDEAVRWLVFLRQMRATGMPLARLREYIAQRELGRDGLAGVLTVLRDHRQAVVAARSELDDCLAVVEAKIAKYERLARVGEGPGTPEV
jgi:DNA-binding transcriptional MerR regulator